MPRFSKLLLVLALVLSVVSCNALSKLKFHSKPKKDADTAGEGVRAIGTVEMVNPESGFVIVHTLGNVPITPGTELSSVNAAGEVSKLKVTPERKTIFITADIVSGHPAKGDTVLTGPNPTPVAATTTPSPAPMPGSPTAAPAGTVSPVSGIPQENLLRSTPAVNAPPPLPLPTPQQGEFLRVVPPGAPQ